MARQTQRKLNNRFIRDRGYGPRRQVVKVTENTGTGGTGGGSTTITNNYYLSTVDLDGGDASTDTSHASWMVDGGSA